MIFLFKEKKNLSTQMLYDKKCSRRREYMLKNIFPPSSKFIELLQEL